MMDQILMQFCDQKHNAWPYIVKQDNTVTTKTKTDTRKRPDQEEDKAWHDCKIR